MKTGPEGKTTEKEEKTTGKEENLERIEEVNADAAETETNDPSLQSQPYHKLPQTLT